MYFSPGLEKYKIQSFHFIDIRFLDHIQVMNQYKKKKQIMKMKKSCKSKGNTTFPAKLLSMLLLVEILTFSRII